MNRVLAVNGETHRHRSGITRKQLNEAIDQGLFPSTPARSPPFFHARRFHRP
ncbi:MAG: hypothetical protein HZY78_06310 [Burkholderiaceae bacterium]|nr:MAG: hypothetical protein HZY78_06310 [Burkholderiaceae bacterium]